MEIPMRSLAILFLLPAICAAAPAPSTRPAAVILHIERVHITTDFDPNIRAIPLDAQRLDSIETLVQSGSDYHCAMTGGGVVTQLSGMLWRSADDFYLVEIDYRRSFPDGTQQFKSSVMLK